MLNLNVPPEWLETIRRIGIRPDRRMGPADNSSNRRKPFAATGLGLVQYKEPRLARLAPQTVSSQSQAATNANKITNGGKDGNGDQNTNGGKKADFMAACTGTFSIPITCTCSN
jgi:hypothetical protein